MSAGAGEERAASPGVSSGRRGGLAPALAWLECWVAGRLGWRRRVLAAALGALAAAALPPVYVVLALIPAFVGLFWLVENTTRPRAAFADGWWFGLGHFVAGLYWVGSSMLVQPERYAWLIPFAVTGLAAVMALFPAAAAFAVRAFAGLAPARVGRVLVFAAAWTVFEWVRSWALTGFPWNLLGTVWVFSDAMIQAAALFGVYGLSLITVAVAAMPAAMTGAAAPDLRAGPVLAAFAVLALVWAGGALRLMNADGAVVPGVRLRLVQGNIDQALKWRRDLRLEHVEKQLRLSALPPRAGPGDPPGAIPPSPTHVIWSETAVPFFLGRDPRLLAMIGSVAPPGGVAIVGAPRGTPRGKATYRLWNSLLAVDRTGRIVAAYDKVHLVPFGEYVPFASILGITKLTAGRTDFSPGVGLRSLRLPGLPPVSPLICYEIIFPGRVTDHLDRPDWLLNITNDGWFGHTSGPYQHLAAARMRAVEEGLPLVRVANTGISAVVDSYGRIVDSLGLGTAGIIDAGLPRPYGLTLYARLGNWTLLFMVLAAAGAGVVLPRSRTE